MTILLRGGKEGEEPSSSIFDIGQRPALAATATTLREALAADDLQRRLGLCDQALGTKAPSPFAFELRADAKRRLAALKKADPLLLRAAHDDADVAVATGSPRGLLVRARILKQQGHHDLADADYAAFLEQRPDDDDDDDVEPLVDDIPSSSSLSS